MGYQPPPQPGGEPTRPTGDYTPPSEGSYTPPSEGSYTPPSEGSYTPPPTGEYTLPPTGGYTPPPTGGGYSAPPPPPPTGGYTPPPTGGYGTPLTAPITPGGGNPSNLAHLPMSYLNAVTKPNVATYEGEIPNASWMKVLLGIAAVALVGLLTGFLGVGAAQSQVDQLITQYRQQGMAESVIQVIQNIRGFLGVLPFISLILPFISFFLGTGIQHFAVKSIGKAEGGHDFMTQSYLSSLSYTPLRVVSGLVGIIPLVGSCVSFALTIYQIFCVGVGLQAGQRAQPGRAQMAAFIPMILSVVLSVCLCGVFFLLIAGAASNR